MHIKFLVQILRADGWRKLTTFRPQETGRIDRDRAIVIARTDAERSLRGWRDYFGPGEKLRIETVEGW